MPLPKLLTFAPCEKILQESETKNISLISLLHEIIVDIPESVSIGEKMSTPIPWAIFASWYQEAPTEQMTFRQHCELVGPNGDVLRALHVDFSMTKVIHHSIMRIRGFPLVPGGGQYRVVISIGRPDKEEREEIASYPITVTFRRGERS